LHFIFHLITTVSNRNELCQTEYTLENCSCHAQTQTNVLFRLSTLLHLTM